MTIKAATYFVLLTGLGSLGLAISAKLKGIEQIWGHDPIIAFTGPVLAIGAVWTLGIAVGLLPAKAAKPP